MGKREHAPGVGAGVADERDDLRGEPALIVAGAAVRLALALRQGLISCDGRPCLGQFSRRYFSRLAAGKPCAFMRAELPP